MLSMEQQWDRLGTAVRQANFQRTISPILVEVDGNLQEMNVDKKSFSTRTCGELIHKRLRDWKDRHHIETGDRACLRVIEPFRRFRLEP